MLNYYAPTQNFENKQIEYLKIIEKELTHFKKENMIILGDFNVQLGQKSCKTSNKAYKEQLMDLIENENLEDIILNKNQEKDLFTWSNRKHKTRIDYIFIHEHLCNIVTESK